MINDRRMVLSGSEVPHLVEARRKGRASWLWTGLAVLSGGIGSVFLLLVTIGLLLFDPSTLTSMIFLLFGSLPWVAAFLAWRRRGIARREGEAEVRRAQLSAARDVLGGAARDLTAQDMARYLELPVAPTEQLLAELNVDDSIVSEVTDAGEVTYRLAPLRVRIDEAYERSRIDPSASETLDIDSEADEAAHRRRSHGAPDDGAGR